MEEKKKQIKISLGIAICLAIIVILVIALVGMWFYFKDKTEDNILETSMQNIIQQNNNETIENENQQEILENDDKITNKEFIKNVSLNGNSHEIAFNYKNNTKMEDSNEKEKWWSEVEILFDNKVIKTFSDIYAKKENPEIKIILGTDGKQYAIIIINTYSVTSITKYFTFINEKGEILGILDYSDATSISYNGKILSYEINENSMKLFKPVWLEITKDSCAIEYEVKINTNILYIKTIRIYSDDEVEFAGAKP